MTTFTKGDVALFLERTLKNGTIDKDLDHVKLMLTILEDPEYRNKYGYTQEEINAMKVNVTLLFRSLLIEKAKR